jgi:predicted RNA binding protein YcfA (HicA-like mRNA interferase family)
MSKLSVLSGIEVCRILEKHGFANLRQKGSHIIMQRKLETTTITVPVPNHSEIKIGTLLSIIRQSRVPREAFEA